jgi:putative membrane protein
MQLQLPEYFFTDLLSTVAFGVVAIFLVVFGYKVFDKLTAKLDFDDLIIKGNIAMAIVIGSFIIGLCHVVARVVSAILGG